MTKYRVVKRVWKDKDGNSGETFIVQQKYDWLGGWKDRENPLGERDKYRTIEEAIKRIKYLTQPSVPQQVVYES